MAAGDPGIELVVFDLDGTLTRRDTLLPYVFGYLLRRPWRLPRLIVMLPALLGFACGVLDRGGLKSWLVRAGLGGQPRAPLMAWNARFLPRLLSEGLHAEALRALDAARERGACCVLLSASPDLYVPEIGARLGFARTICTGVRWRPDGRLDGRLSTANRRGAEKARCVTALLDELRPALSTAYGNSRADLAHLRLVREGVYVGRRRPANAPPSIRFEPWRTPGGLAPPATAVGEAGRPGR